MGMVLLTLVVKMTGDFCIVHRNWHQNAMIAEYFALQAGAHKDESNIPEMQNTTMI